MWWAQREALVAESSVLQSDGADSASNHELEEDSEQDVVNCSVCGDLLPRIES